MSEKSKLVICPYCGHTQSNKDRCESCGGYFEPLSRMATQIAMGPWFVRDTSQPFRPGCSIEVIRKQIKSGKIKANTVLRGPTTRQFWTVARFAPGVAHLLGYCDACGAHVDPSDLRCHECGHSFLVHEDRNQLGLQYPSDDEAERAERLLEEKMRLGTLEKKAGGLKEKKQARQSAAGGATARSAESVGHGPTVAKAPTPTAPASTASTPVVGGDLLDQIIGTSSFATASASSSAGVAEGFEHGSDLLEFERQPEMEPTTPLRPTPESKTAALAAASASTQSTGPVPRRSSTTMIVLLVLTNVLLLVGVILFAIFLMGRQNPPGRANSANPPADRGDAGSRAHSGGNRLVINPNDIPTYELPPDDPTPAPDTANTEATYSGGYAGGSESDPLLTGNDPLSADTDPASLTGTDGDVPPPPRAQKNVIQLNRELLDQARDALEAEPPDNTRALSLLRRYKTITPPKYQWRGVDEAITRLEADQATPRPRTIFDFDTEP